MANPIILMIKLENGQISLQGPLHDKILCSGMMELAKVALLQPDSKPSAPIIAPPRNGTLGVVN